MYETNMGLYENKSRYVNKDEVRSSKFLAKVYGYMFIALLITAAIAGLVGFGFYYALNSASEEVAEEILMALMGAVVVSAIGLLICSLSISIISIRNKHSIMIPGTLYSIFMGVLVGLVVMPFGLTGDWWIVISAFGITAMTFGIMYIIGATVKTNLNWLGMLGMGMLFGAMMLSLTFFLLFIFAPALFDWLYVLIDSVIFVAFILITMWDVWRIQKIAERSNEDNNLALFCAFTLYSDFVYIFLRILMILAKLSRKR